ncbi:MAG: toprim domain-containing protein [Nitrospirae bacterium]|nr:toprim domain-containing protein [Nitrospirota bacterium]
MDTKVYEAFYSLLDTGHVLLDRFCDERGISIQVCKKAGTRVLGQYDSVQNALFRWFGAERVKRAGLANQAGHLIFYAHRIIFPWKNESGTPTYFTARAVKGVNDGPKELCLIGTTPVLPYNAPTVTTGQDIHICEGNIDALTLEDMALRAVATGGTEGLRRSWIGWLKSKRVSSVIPAYDADSTGQAKSREVEELARKVGLKVGRLFLPTGHDVNSYFGKGPTKKAMFHVARPGPQHIMAPYPPWHGAA